MTAQVLDFANELLNPDRLATAIADKWLEWDRLRSTWKQSKEEIRRYVYATDTTQTSNSSLPWKNKTTIPKLCHIRDNLYSNYTATLFPQRKWLLWEANEKASESVSKRDSIVNYMGWSIEQTNFKSELDKTILDYIDFGNGFVMPEWIDERVEKEDGTVQSGFIGPTAKRIDPLSIVFNPVAESFQNSPKIIRTLISRGELKKMLKKMTNEGNKEEYEALWNYLDEIRSNATNYLGEWIQHDRLYQMDGFTSFRNYLQSDYVEILTFYGDIYDTEKQELLENYVITVCDRHKLIGKKPNPSFFATAPIFHVGWRKRQDNLWAMGPLDNLIGMQYRLDHIENMRADIVDLTTYPVQMVKGFVEDYLWQPGEKIYTSEDGTVELLQPKVEILQANFDLQRYENTMEEMAGAPKEAMGFRTPGEKTKYEVQRLENAASRVFQNKIKQFEEHLVEPLLNSMLELARRNLSGSTTIKIFDDELKVASFESLTPEDITGVGRIRPIAARHFAEQANFVQNMTNLSSSGLWPMVQPHVSGIALSKAFEHIFDASQYQLFLPFVALAEQADAQKFAQVLQEQVHNSATTATGRNMDYDLTQGQSPIPVNPVAAQPNVNEHPFLLDRPPGKGDVQAGLLPTQ